MLQYRFAMECLTEEFLPKLYSLKRRGKGTQKHNTPFERLLVSPLAFQ
jgi:hypothetical protein